MLSCKVQETPYFVEFSGDYIIKIVSKVASITTVVFVASMCYGQCDAVFVNAESTLLWSSECSCSPENGGLDTMIFGMTVSHIENEAGPCGWGSQRSGCGTNANTFQIGGGVPIWAATIVCPEPYANDVIFCQHPSVPPPPPRMNASFSMMMRTVLHTARCLRSVVDLQGLVFGTITLRTGAIQNATGLLRQSSSSWPVPPATLSRTLLAFCELLHLGWGLRVPIILIRS